ncbi:MFS transporter [Planobispora takensis]|uniref:MFS transporter n=1 Tax=Planobispora takensis TaxID=1367882 RepID=A0A8J3T8T5_9ACTN|nr:MFS transporter [Planobispora takensis]GII03019.1 MFS transporter [Planobispora takensis]
MIISSSRAPGARAKRLAATLYAYVFLDDLILLYPVYALLFADTGLSVSEISSLFVLWALTGIVLEVPSGVWADAVSRRLLLAFAPLLGAAGFALWAFVPSYWAFALGFVLWGARGSLVSGAFEALAYEELDRLGAAGRYAQILGRTETAGLIAVGVATAAAGPVFALGGYPALGVASVAACLLCAAVALALPEHRSAADPDEDDDPRGYVEILRSGLAEARGDRSVRRALLLVPAVAALWGALEEYVALLVQETGVSDQAVPVWVLLVWAGMTAGGLLAGAGRRLTAKALAAVIALAALILGGGALSGRPEGVFLVAAAFCAFQMATVVADARLQERITGPNRATVTSLANLGTDLTTVLAYGMYAVVSEFAGHGTVFAVLSAPYLLLALAMAHDARTRRNGEVDGPALSRE